jgi:hypothetical protein
MRNSKFLLAAAFLLFFSTRANAQLQRNDSELQLFESLNRERTAQGLSALQWDDTLFKAARQHALRMADLNILEHQLPNESNLEGRLTEAGARFSVIAENIAVGWNPQTIHTGWMDSPGHRKNILDPRLNSVGIAAVRGTGGLFAVQDFSHIVPQLTVEEQEQKVVSFLTARGFLLTNAKEGARKTCETGAEFSGTSARAMVRFEVADLNKLPEEIERKIRRQPFGRVAVGACRANKPAGFTQYRIAVLFF